ncbi:uncharacterized protein LOC131941416 [Physella acuta]|uniref:uncharacterized protein LOC131941416 n=1 Tax=Physella acuta TaxID=109671 RepID=UPI0027DAD1C3|nr:uncharacterized protein LOC131941416 [Physella acuta]
MEIRFSGPCSLHSLEVHGIYTPSIIPHYIKFNYKNRPVNILVAIPGRRQACQSCDSTQHCPLSSQTTEPEPPRVTPPPQQQTASQEQPDQQAVPTAKPNNQPTAQDTATPVPQPSIPSNLQDPPTMGPIDLTSEMETSSSMKRKNQTSPTELGKTTKGKKKTHNANQKPPHMQLLPELAPNTRGTNTSRRYRTPGIQAMLPLQRWNNPRVYF